MTKLTNLDSSVFAVQSRLRIPQSAKTPSPGSCGRLARVVSELEISKIVDETVPDPFIL